jgi:TonB family protein
MASLGHPSRDRSGGRVILPIALVVLCLAAAATAQTDPAAPATVVLKSKAASKLLLDQEKPEYPTLAKVNYIQGQVRLQVAVNPEGKVREVHVVRGHAFLAAAAMKAIAHWVYRPYKTIAGPKGFLTFVDVNFNLRYHRIESQPPEPETFLSRQVKPPEVLEKTPAAAPNALLRLRVLVSAEGRAMDSELVEGPVSLISSARRNLEGWTFRPARWGNHSVPWYLDVDVPVGGDAAAGSAGAPGSQ